MSKNNSNNGIDVLSLLGITFIVLKLTKVIDWSWWYVTLPFWGGLLLCLLGFGILVLYHIIKSLKNKSQKTESSFKKPIRKTMFQKRLEKTLEKRK